MSQFIGSLVRNSKLVFIATLFFSIIALAEGGGDTKADAKDAVPAGPTSEQEVQSLIGRLQTLRARLEARNKEIKELQEKIQHEEELAKKTELANQMKLEHEELVKDTKDYNETLYKLKYQFPERGSLKLSEEKAKEIKTLKELEEEHSIEGRIRKNMRTVRKAYGMKDPKLNKPQKQKPPEPEKPAPDPLLQPVIIRK